MKPDRHEATHPTPEASVARALREALDATDVGAEAELPDESGFESALAYFLTERLARDHDPWCGESLDGFLGLTLRRVGHRDADLAGFCTLLSVQEDVVFRAALRLDRTADRIVGWCVGIGTMGPGRLGLLTVSAGASCRRLGNPRAVDEWAYLSCSGTRSQHLAPCRRKRSFVESPRDKAPS